MKSAFIVVALVLASTPLARAGELTPFMSAFEKATERENRVMSDSRLDVCDRIFFTEQFLGDIQQGIVSGEAGQPDDLTNLKLGKADIVYLKERQITVKSILDDQRFRCQKS